MAREGKTSVSDLFSDDFVNYIKDPKNWEKPEKMNEPKYKEYISGKTFYDEIKSSQRNNSTNKRLLEKNHKNSIHHFLTATLKKNQAQTQRNFNDNDNIFCTPILKTKKKTLFNCEESLKLFSDELSGEMKQKISEYLQKQNIKFEKDMNLIDNLDRSNCLAENRRFR